MEEWERAMMLFSGMITKDQASDIASGKRPFLSQGSLTGKSGSGMLLSVEGVIRFVEMQRGIRLKKEGAGRRRNYSINVEGKVYRIFNPQTYSYNGREVKKRIVVLGTEGSTITFALFDEASDMIDSLGICRGDSLVAMGAVLDAESGEMKGVKHSRIKRGGRADSAIALPEDNKTDADIAGTVVDAHHEEYVDGHGRARGRCVRCCIRMAEKPTEIFFSGSSADAAEGLKERDTIRVEFCTLIVKDGGIEAYADDRSRVLVMQGGHRERQL